MIRRVLVAPILSACAGSPTYLHGSGYRADREAALGWVLLIIAAAVVVVVTLALIVGMVRRRQEGTDVTRSGTGLRWIIVGGIAAPTFILAVVLVLAMKTLAQDAAPTTTPTVAIQVIGHRWWWEVRYLGQAPSDRFVTANELHIPVGQPVRLELATADVIHSFWIPQLAGKTDLIPGQQNVTWIEADSAGTYSGRCGEYCGLQHANMMLSVTADPPDWFARWLETQRAVAAEPSDTAAVTGRAVFVRSACALCHTIRGTGAGGALGPDLTHVASRRTIGAGVLPNTQGNLAGWVANPQGIKPGVTMPVVPLPPGELHAVLSYLQSLK